MLRSLYTAATGMDAQQTKMDVISDNLANASTTGFKKSRADFEELFAEQLTAPQAPDPRTENSPVPLEVGLGVKTGSTSRMMAQGDLVNTTNPLDLAIQGNGFFQVQRPSGEIAYTRAGNLRVDGTGRLVSAQGDPLNPPINVPNDATAVTVTATGKVTATIPNQTNPIELGSIELATFANPAGLSRLGGAMLGASAASGDPVVNAPGAQGTGTLNQGYLEGANVTAVSEMVDMIAAQRAFEMNSKVIQTADQMLQKITSIR